MNQEYIQIGIKRLEYWQNVKIKEEKKIEEAAKKPIGQKLW